MLVFKCAGRRGLAGTKYLVHIFLTPRVVDTYAFLFPRTIRSLASPEMKSSKVGPEAKVSENAFFELDGVAKYRAFLIVGRDFRAALVIFNILMMQQAKFRNEC